jgi:hypothetical protein
VVSAALRRTETLGRCTIRHDTYDVDEDAAGIDSIKEDAASTMSMRIPAEGRWTSFVIWLAQLSECQKRCKAMKKGVELRPVPSYFASGEVRCEPSRRQAQALSEHLAP